jgi:hypothetical protein
MLSFCYRSYNTKIDYPFLGNHRIIFCAESLSFAPLSHHSLHHHLGQAAKTVKTIAPKCASFLRR